MATRRSSAVLMKDAANERTVFLNGVIELWTGAQQASADDPMTGTKVAVVTANGGAFTPGSPANGITFDAPVLEGGKAVLKKPAATAWSGTALAAGTVASAVYRANAADANAASTTLDRMCLSVSTEAGSGDLKLSTLTYTAGAPVTIQSGEIRFGNSLPAV